MSSTIHEALRIAADADYPAEVRRANAVAAALEVIAAKATQSGAHVTHLDVEFNRLAEYADQIQAAIAVK